MHVRANSRKDTHMSDRKQTVPVVANICDEMSSFRDLGMCAALSRGTTRPDGADILESNADVENERCCQSILDSTEDKRDQGEADVF